MGIDRTLQYRYNDDNVVVNAVVNVDGESVSFLVLYIDLPQIDHLLSYFC
jgi:hypothetical protein